MPVLRCPGWLAGRRCPQGRPPAQARPLGTHEAVSEAAWSPRRCRPERLRARAWEVDIHLPRSHTGLCSCLETVSRPLPLGRALCPVDGGWRGTTPHMHVTHVTYAHAGHTHVSSYITRIHTETLIARHAQATRARARTHTHSPFRFDRRGAGGEVGTLRGPARAGCREGREGVHIWFLYHPRYSIVRACIHSSCLP